LSERASKGEKREGRDRWVEGMKEGWRKREKETRGKEAMDSRANGSFNSLVLSFS